MGYETGHIYTQSPEEEARQILEQEALRIQKLSEPESPVSALGNLVVGIAFGGALNGGAVLPRTEAVTLELLAGTTKMAEAAEYERKLAA